VKKLAAGVVLMLALVVAGAALAQGDNLFARQTRWSVEESWHKDRLVYTMEADGTFRSSLESGGKGVGRYMRDGSAFVMIWPRYDYAVYVGTIGNREIRGSGYSKDGKPIGTFVLRLMP
jgi:hypothetical protein